MLPLVHLPPSLSEFFRRQRKNPFNNTEKPKGAIQSCLGKFALSHGIFRLPTEKSVSLAFASKSQVALHGLSRAFFGSVHVSIHGSLANLPERANFSSELPVCFSCCRMSY
jgi:hypothetical protein